MVSTLDGEPGRIVEPVTYNRSHTKVTSYIVLTNDGRELWEADELFVPDQQN